MLAGGMGNSLRAMAYQLNDGSRPFPWLMWSSAGDGG